MVETDQPQRCRVIQRKDETKRALTAHESADRVVNLASKRSHGLATFRWNPVVDRRDHSVPVVEEIAGGDRRHETERNDRDQRSPPFPCRAEEGGEPAARECRELAERALGL